MRKQRIPIPARVYDRSSEGQSELSTAGRSPIHGKPADGHDVAARRQRLAGWAAPRQPERVPAREHVAQSREHSDRRPVGAREPDVEPRERHELEAAGDRADASGIDAEQRRLPVGGPKAVVESDAERMSPTGAGPNAIAQGTRIAPPPSMRPTTAPSAVPVPTGCDAITASTCTSTLPPRASTTCAGRSVKSTAAAPSSCVRIPSVTRSSRVERFVNVNDACSAGRLSPTFRARASAATPRPRRRLPRRRRRHLPPAR